MKGDLKDGFSYLALSMGRELEDYDSDDDYEECCNKLISDAASALIKFNIFFDGDTGEFVQKKLIKEKR